MLDWSWYVYTSLIFWGTVAWIARSPRTTQLPPASMVTIHRARRHGVRVTAVVDSVSDSPSRDARPALPARTVTVPALVPARSSGLRALPKGAIAAPGPVAARPMPARSDW